MLSIKYIRENTEKVQESLSKKNSDIKISELLDLDVKRRDYLQEVEKLRAEKNKASNDIAELKKLKKDTGLKISSMRYVAEKIKGIETNLKNVEKDIQKLIYFIPNLVHSSVPQGKDESENRQVREWGVKPEFSFKVRNHMKIGESLKLFDFQRAVKMAGAAFPLYTGMGAKLERALINYMLDIHIEKHGYQELFPPFLANRKAMQNTGQLPKFEDDMYHIAADHLFCIPTAEVPVTNIHQGETLYESDLPIRYTAYTACFRREAGSYGQETKGLSRLHQFNKVELVKFVCPDTSYDELETLVNDAEDILQSLGLHYRLIELCSGDLSFSAAKCYDLEVWSPADKKYLEVSSCSNFEDFQSRRSDIRYRNKTSRKVELVHTLNGSGVATPRLMIALLETYQQEDGTVILPEVLQPYMNTDRISI